MNHEKTNINAIGIIPVRYDSTRLPGKPLIDICGKPLLQRVWESVSSSKILHRIVVATDDKRIANLCDELGAEYVMTASLLPSGTDRIASAYKLLNENADIIVNIQGDEPFLTGEIIDDLVIEFANSFFDVGTLIKKISLQEELFNPSIVKVVLGNDNRALYFSRSPIPHLRDENSEHWHFKIDYWKHIGVYAYRKKVLFNFVELAPTNIELSEKLEQLRLLGNGAKFLCVKTEAELIGVDTPEDLEKVRKILSKV